jgi:hypothetical protein
MNKISVYISNVGNALIPICFQDEAKAHWIFGFWEGANEEHIPWIRDE